MRFGIFYEHQLPRPWAPGDEHRLLTDALEQVELADRLGIDYLWLVEHHFLEEYSHSSAPEVFLAAASQRTSRVRLGHGIVQLPPAYNHPARVAERIATLDLLSDGRVEFGRGGRRRWSSSPGCWWRSRSLATRGSSSMCHHATWSPSRCSARTLPCGSPAPAARPSTWPPPRASARCRSRSSSPTAPRNGWTTTTPPSRRRRACRRGSRSTRRSPACSP